MTRATNTQNGVDARDFIAFDSEQDKIRAQLRIQFDKVYGVKRSGERIADTDGCDVEEAAIALACAHQDPSYAVHAKRQVSTLWASIEDPIYRELFPKGLNVARLWNSVMVLRTVEATLAEVSKSAGSRAKGVAIHGNRLIAHLKVVS